MVAPYKQKKPKLDTNTGATDPSAIKKKEEIELALNLAVPKCFVIKSGKLTRSADQLVHDLRRVMEPNTASRLKERRRNSIKDFLSMAGPLHVSHIQIITQTEESMNLKVGKTPQGPTAYFRILKYSLNKDVTASQPRPRSPGLEYRTAPLLVLNNFDVIGREEDKLTCSILRNMYPTVKTSKLSLNEIRRVVLYHMDHETNTIYQRHYFINVRNVGVSRQVKQVLKTDIPDLSSLNDISEFILKEGTASESELDEDSLVTLSHDYHGVANKKSSQRSINLVEIGPRISMRLIKITGGFCEGEVLYHCPADKLNGIVSADGEI